MDIARCNEAILFPDASIERKNGGPTPVCLLLLSLIRQHHVRAINFQTVLSSNPTTMPH